MTKMEILALRGVADKLQARKAEPKPDWMSEDMHRGRVDAFDIGEAAVRELLGAALDPGPSHRERTP